ncbi:hypothetical protein DWB77_07338 [Streptomyces hundungensis]|uniref:Uncharacterized protein n=1 Tax=Streptomyces hundungensis TaxID=1077946 RepID=A0A387HSJ6_9ACTN|nr:hypothetical protein [Streptomyces hundungensis]AYG85122.1 hypothetical protein DWB77_07338 [Streptomyces hundungensis]
MNDDVVHIVPCDDQSVEEIAEVLSQAAAEQGLDDEVVIDGEEVIAPRSLMTGSAPVVGVGFPPPPAETSPDGSSHDGQYYRLQSPIALGLPHRGQ